MLRKKESSTTFNKRAVSNTGSSLNIETSPSSPNPDRIRTAQASEMSKVRITTSFSPIS